VASPSASEDMLGHAVVDSSPDTCGTFGITGSDDGFTPLSTLCDDDEVCAEEEESSSASEDMLGHAVVDSPPDTCGTFSL
jgi:hypothetical protein